MIQTDIAYDYGTQPQTTGIQIKTGAMNFENVRRCLKSFDFKGLFVEELGWQVPPSKQEQQLKASGEVWKWRYVAQMDGVAVIRLVGEQGLLPDRKTREKVHNEVQKLHYEHLLIFTDDSKERCLWSWRKMKEKRVLRDHYYSTSQPGDLFLSKLAPLFIDLSDLDESGRLCGGVAAVADRLKGALDMERVTKRFFRDYKEQHEAFSEGIRGLEGPERRWYASVLLNRLMFIWFLQKKGFLGDQDTDYLSSKLEKIRSLGTNQYYRKFLQPLFFRGLALPENRRNKDDNTLFGSVPYLNGGLFASQQVETNPDVNIEIDDLPFEKVFGLFNQYSWHLNDTPSEADNDINPSVLGHIFEKYINQKEFGAYYTPPQITGYLCRHTIHDLILKRVRNGTAKTGGFANLNEMLRSLDSNLCGRLFNEILPDLTILDPACGSGAFLVEAMMTLYEIYMEVVGRIRAVGNPGLKSQLSKFEKTHPSIDYAIKKKIIAENLFGVDVMAEAVEICRLRLFMALVTSVARREELEPLPNIDFNVLAGNSLIGLLRVKEEELGQANIESVVGGSYREQVEKYEGGKQEYRAATGNADELAKLRDNLVEQRKDAYGLLNNLLLDKFQKKKIKKTITSWDEGKRKAKRPEKADLSVEDITATDPFHWGFEFHRVLNEKNGFDLILTNPPWETFKPYAKEFFVRYSDLVSQNTMTIKEFEKHKSEVLLKNPEIRQAWFKYLDSYPYISEWFHCSEGFLHQRSTVTDPITGKKKNTGSGINLFKLFLEQSYNLLHEGGCCGILVPSGLYTDQGAKGLRQMLFEQNRVTGLFGFENRKRVFDGVDSRFKFVVLTFEKGGTTQKFPAAFMRHDVDELERFPDEGSIDMRVSDVKKMSPSSLSLMEIKNNLDLKIIEKMMRFPMLGEKIEGQWNLELGTEFNMTNDSPLFQTAERLESDGWQRVGEEWRKDKERCLPLYEGKMIHQYDHLWKRPHSGPKYWINESDARRKILGNKRDDERKLRYQDYRIGFRRIASNTNERTMIMTILPSNLFCANTLQNGYLMGAHPSKCRYRQLIWLVALSNSFIFDFMFRMKIAATTNFFYVYQMPMPRLDASDPIFRKIVDRASQLICTSPEFDDLAKGVGLEPICKRCEDAEVEEKFKAEIDALAATAYGLTEEEFTHVLKSFPLIDGRIINLTRNAFRDAERGLIE